MSEANPYGDLEEVFQEFISECREMLDGVEPYLIELESRRGTDGQVDAETIGSIFRVFHSVKGSAGFLQLDVLVQMTHQAGTLLDLIRMGKIELSPDHTGLLCRCCDLIRLMLDTVEEGRGDAEHAAAGGAMEAELGRAATPRIVFTAVAERQGHDKGNSTMNETVTGRPSNEELEAHIAKTTSVMDTLSEPERARLQGLVEEARQRYEQVRVDCTRAYEAVDDWRLVAKYRVFDAEARQRETQKHRGDSGDMMRTA